MLTHGLRPLPTDPHQMDADLGAGGTTGTTVTTPRINRAAQIVVAPDGHWLGDIFQPCERCATATHCAHWGRCLAECVPADLASSSERTDLSALRSWWLSKRPVSFSHEDHRLNPTVNCATDTEKQLARAAAILFQADLFPADGLNE